MLDEHFAELTLCCVDVLSRPPVMPIMMDREALAKLYLTLDYSQKEILTCLTYSDGAVMSQRHFRRILRKLGLRRFTDENIILHVAIFIEKQLQGSGKLRGYRWMQNKCVQDGLSVTQRKAFYTYKTE